MKHWGQTPSRCLRGYHLSAPWSISKTTPQCPVFIRLNSEQTSTAILVSGFRALSQQIQNVKPDLSSVWHLICSYKWKHGYMWRNRVLLIECQSGARSVPFACNLHNHLHPRFRAFSKSGMTTSRRNDCNGFCKFTGISQTTHKSNSLCIVFNTVLAWVNAKINLKGCYVGLAEDSCNKR